MTYNHILTTIFNNPIFYTSLMRILGSKNATTKIITEFIKPNPGDKIFDFGCGPAEILNYLPANVEYVGFDFNEKCIHSARMKFGNRGTFFLGDISNNSLHFNNQFDIVLAIGVLHHLSDKDAIKLIDDGVNLLKNGGRLITLDNIDEDYIGIVNKFALKMDRGKNIRNKNSYVHLFKKYPEVRFTIMKAPMRISYYHIICELNKKT